MGQTCGSAKIRFPPIEQQSLPRIEKEEKGEEEVDEVEQEQRWRKNAGRFRSTTQLPPAFSSSADRPPSMRSVAASSTDDDRRLSQLSRYSEKATAAKGSERKGNDPCDTVFGADMVMSRAPQQKRPNGLRAATSCLDGTAYPEFTSVPSDSPMMVRTTSGDGTTTRSPVMSRATTECYSETRPS